MHIETLRDYILKKENVEEGFPFGPDVWVVKVNGRMFILVPLDEVPLRFNLKCEPDMAISLREEYPEHILPGYHMNKKNWNTVVMGGSIPQVLVRKMIDDSYQLVKSLPAKR